MFEKKQNNSDYPGDELLLAQVEQGNMSSFNTLYEKHWEAVYVNAYKRLKDHDQASDIVQDIFTHLWIKREALSIVNLPAYLNIAVRNKVFKIAAKSQLSHPFFDVLENISSPDYHPDANVLAKEFYGRYENLVNSLPEKKQLIFRLRYYEDRSTKEIAQELGISRKTVQNQLASAVDQLKVSLICLHIVLIDFLLACLSD